jgi:hypothetical protein
VQKTALAAGDIYSRQSRHRSRGHQTPRPFEFVSVVPLGGDVPIISARGNRSKSFPAPLYLRSIRNFHQAGRRDMLPLCWTTGQSNGRWSEKCLGKNWSHNRFYPRGYRHRGRVAECSGPKPPPPPEKEDVLCCDYRSKTSCKLPNPLMPNPGKRDDLCRCPGMIGRVSRYC